MYIQEQSLWGKASGFGREVEASLSGAGVSDLGLQASEFLANKGSRCIRFEVTLQGGFGAIKTKAWCLGSCV